MKACPGWPSEGKGQWWPYMKPIPLPPEHRLGIRDLRYILSDDGGRSWTDPQSIGNKIREDDSRSFGFIQRMADGEVGICWLDTDPQIEGGRPLYFARTQGDNRFSPPVKIQSRVCPCCRTALTISAQGEIQLAFRDLDPDSHRDISLAWSQDGGKSFKVLRDQRRSMEAGRMPT